MDPKVSAIYKETTQQLTPLFGEREAEVMTDMLFTDMLGISKTDRLIDREQTVSPQKRDQLNGAIARLLTHEPIQHILGEAHFYNRIFQVNKHVLVPRPETEELVDLIKRENRRPHLKVLDIGTGTGCIAISLALEMNKPEIYALDVSNDALIVAEENAKKNNAKVSFQHMDILTEDIQCQGLDVVVSNPPYIPWQEKKQMDRNVSDFDPELALFVPDDDPLLFYRVIAEKAKKALKPEGKLYFEIHESFGPDTVALLSGLGYVNVSLIKDMQGKDRMIKAYFA